MHFSPFFHRLPFEEVDDSSADIDTPGALLPEAEATARSGGSSRGQESKEWLEYLEYLEYLTAHGTRVQVPLQTPVLEFRYRTKPRYSRYSRYSGI